MVTMKIANRRREMNKKILRKGNSGSKRKRIVLVLSSIALLFLLIGFAWYYYQTHRVVHTEDEKIMSPYNLYLLDASGTDYLNFTVGNLHPGETKQVVIGVSNQDPKAETEGFAIAKESVFDYELELAYTKNLPIQYKVYELDKLNRDEIDSENVPEDVIKVEEKNGSDGLETIGYWKKKLNKDQSNPLIADSSLTDKINKEMYGDETGSIPNSVKNLGQYDMYSVGTDGTSKLQLTTTVNNNEVNFDLDYYLIQIEWNDGIQFEDYKKETDLVYVIVKALQLKPEEMKE